MGRIHDSEVHRLLALQTPPYAVVMDAANRWLVRRGLSAREFARLLNKGHSTINLFLQGRWEQHMAGTKYAQVNPELLTARVWEYLQAHPLEAKRKPTDKLLPTRSAGEIRRLCQAGLFHGAFVILYGPPSAEKSFVLENFAAEREAAGYDDVFYIYCSPRLRPLSLLMMLAREAGLGVRSVICWNVMNALVNEYKSRPHLPLIIADEAQHMTLDTLETLRELRDRTARPLEGKPGCGIIMAGSHDFYRWFVDPRQLPRVGQLLSRITHKTQLAGMDEDEVLEIAARALGNGKPARLGGELRKKILDACRDRDFYALDGENKPAPHDYYSPRKLSTYLDRVKDKLAAKRESRA